MANEVVYYSSDETGAPTLNNAAGSLLAVLDACLVNGFNAKSVTSIVVAGGVATATISAHGVETGRIGEFAGATPSGLNGRKKLTVTGANTVTFDATGISDQTATGTITFKRPSLGWLKEFSGTNKAVYKRSDVTATAMKLRVDDTAAGVAATTYARALMVETATDVDTYTNHAPTTAHLSGGQYWLKGANSSTAKAWVLIGDGLMFYLFTDGSSYAFSTYAALHPQGFGDLLAYRSGDAYSSVLIGSDSSGEAASFHLGGALGAAPLSAGFVLARLSNQIGSSIAANLVNRVGASPIGGHSTEPLYPSPVDNGVVIERTVLVSEANSAFQQPIRGHLRGVSAPLAKMPVGLHKNVLSNVAGTTSEFLCVAVVGSGQVGMLLFDLTGPWS